MPASPIRKLGPLAVEAEAKGIKILSLNLAQHDLPTRPEASAALCNINRQGLEYSPSEGLPHLRR